MSLEFSVWFYFKSKLFYLVYVCLCVHVCVHMPVEARSRHSIPWSWSCGVCAASQTQCWDLSPNDDTEW